MKSKNIAAPEMEDLSFDSGVREYKMNRGIFRINMTDDELYYRFIHLQEDIEAMRAEYEAQAKEIDEGADELPKVDSADDISDYVASLSDDESDALSARIIKRADLLHSFDVRVKGKLAEVFNDGNDFDALFDGKSVLAIDTQGNYLISNFFNAITPLIQRAKDSAQEAADKLVGNRDARRAKNQKKD